MRLSGRIGKKFCEVFLKFSPSKPLTVGFELEVQIVDSKDFSLKSSSSEIFRSISSSLIQKEFLDSMLEFVSSPHETPENAVEEVFNEVKRVLDLGRERGFLLSASGTHPFAKPESVRVTENDRYLRLLEEFQEILRNFLIYGLHIHVGFPDEESMINAYNVFVEYSSLFLALSVSSPFFRGRNTGIYSYRSKLFEQLPRAGVPQQFSSYEEFLDLFSILKETQTVESLKDVWWDVRPRPDFGTVELRICDSIPSKERIAGLLNLAVMLGSLSFKERVSPYYHQVHLQNRWSAARYGINGYFIDRGRKVKVGTKLLEIVSSFTKHFGGLREGARTLEKLTTEPTLAELQVEAFKRSGDLKPLVKLSLLEV